MSLVKRIRLKGTRQVGLMMAGLLVAGLAAASGTALASSSSGSSTASTASMDSMVQSIHAKTGFTNGWYGGRTVRFFYSKNYFCRTPPASTASSKCEGGANYIRTPASNFDPLYVVVPLGFTPPKWTLQCPVAGNCIDHPSTIDLTAVLGSGTGNLPLPVHSHIVATSNSGQSEWWNIDVVGVKSLSDWYKIVLAKSDWELQYLQVHDSAHVTGNITTNLFLYFSVRH
jgi:hypothetical protein